MNVLHRNRTPTRHMVHAESGGQPAAIDEGRLRRSSRPTSGGSPRISIRLEPGVLDALERRAAIVGLPPSVLARNLIRAGLASRGDDAVSDAVAQLEAGIAKLRGLVGGLAA